MNFIHILNTYKAIQCRSQDFEKMGLKYELNKVFYSFRV